MKKAIIALDLGGTKLASALFSPDGKRIGKQLTELQQRESSAVGELVLRELDRLLRLGKRQQLSVRAVGVCVPGIVKARSGRVWAPNIAGWEDYPLRAQIHATVANADIKVVVDNDRTASILGEAWQGAARGCRNAIFIAVGTGIGAGILADGRVLRGAHDIAGAIGWLALEPPFRDQYVQCGCFESRASGDGIAKSASALLARTNDYRGPLRTNLPLTAHDVFAAYERSDPVANEVLRQAIEFWGMAAANLVSLFNPEMVIFGGGVFGPAAPFLDKIAVEARRWAQPIAMKKVKFEASQLGGDAALYGAAYIALRRARLI